MLCSSQGCSGSLRITHTYTVNQEKFQRARCARCGAVHRLTTTACPVRSRGDGAKAYAARAKAKPCDSSKASS